jgi:SAM-dependent methyltransferase
LKCTALELDRRDAIRLRTLPGVAVCDLPFEKFAADAGSFDYILMSHVLEHTHNPRQWIETAANLLATGGVLAIMTPHFDSIYRRIGGTRDPYFCPPEHLNHFNRRSLGRLCERCALATEKTYSAGRFPADAISRRVRLPGIISDAVKFATAGASIAVENLTRVTGTGAVLIHFAKKA